MQNDHELQIHYCSVTDNEVIRCHLFVYPSLNFNAVWSFRVSGSLLSSHLTATYLQSRHFANLFQAPYLPAYCLKFHDQVRKHRSCCWTSARLTGDPQLRRASFIPFQWSTLAFILLCEHSVYVVATVNALQPAATSRQQVKGATQQFSIFVFLGRSVSSWYFDCAWENSEFFVRFYPRILGGLQGECHCFPVPLQQLVSPISPGVFPRGVRELNIWQSARRGVTQLTCTWFKFHKNFIKLITERAIIHFGFWTTCFSFMLKQQPMLF